VTDLRDERRFWGIAQVLMLSLPAGLSMLTRTLMRFVDGLMVSWLGHEPFAAQLVAGMTAFAFESFILGTLMAVNTCVSQSFGAGRWARCGEYARAGLALGAMLAAACLPLVWLARPVFALLQQPPALRSLEAMYFRYMIVSIPLGQLALGLARFFYGVHRPGIVFAVTLTSNAFNVLANYVLIFGRWGLPRLGLEGAALGTLSAIGLEFLLMLALFLSPAMHRRFATRRWRFTRRQCREVFRIGWPAGVQFTNDLLSWGVMTSILIGGTFGTLHLAAHTAAIRYMSLSFMPAIGVGIAATALVGRYIGAGRRDLARRRAHAAALLAVAYMGACALLMAVFRHELVRVFVTVSPGAASSAQAAARHADAIVRIGGRIMICAAVFQLFDALGIVYVGALRGAGDTRWPMAFTAVASWTLIVGGGLLAIRVAPRLESLGPWLAAGAYVVVLGVALAWRFESGAWRRIAPVGAGLPAAAESEGGSP
jgi:MATE family multidrug resistance protein